ncbi:MAG: PAS domain S-box-containing protein, partial [bacterium]
MDKKKLITINALTQYKIFEKLAAKTKVTEKHVVSLKQSEDRFNMLLKASEDMITVHEPNGKYTYYNGPICYPITPKDIVGKMPSDLFDKDASNTLLNAFKKVERTGKSETIEVLLDWLGEKKWFSEYIYPVKNADGEVIEMVKVCRNINERKVAEQKIESQNKVLLESDKAHRDVLEASSDLISVVDKNGKILFINHASKKFYGLLPKECLGKSIFDFTHPEDKEYTQTKFVEWGNSKKKNFHFKNRQTSAFGKILETEWSVNIERKGIEIIKITSIIRDITKQKQIEEDKLLAISELKNTEKILNQTQRLAQVGSWLFHPLNQKVEWSDLMFEIWGLDSTKGIPEYDSLVELIHSDDLELFSSSYDKAINSGTSYDIEFRIYLLNGEQKTLRTICQTVMGENGKVITLIGANLDITPQKQIEKDKLLAIENLESKVKFRTQELEKSLEREKELGILKTRFISMASHEFRTPLTSIVSTTDVILKYRDKLSQDNINLRLGKIKLDIEYMTVMLEDFLIIGKSESQKLVYNSNILDIVSLIKELIDEYHLSES